MKRLTVEIKDITRAEQLLLDNAKNKIATNCHVISEFPLTFELDINDGIEFLTITELHYIVRNRIEKVLGSSSFTISVELGIINGY